MNSFYLQILVITVNLLLCLSLQQVAVRLVYKPLLSSCVCVCVFITTKELIKCKSSVKLYAMLCALCNDIILLSTVTLLGRNYDLHFRDEEGSKVQRH
jgi:hypothetical protein